MEKLTRKEALEQGYCLCGHIGQEWQILMRIDELSEDDFKGKTILLADKESIGISVENEELKELIADFMESKWGNDSADDTEEVYKRVKSLDFSSTASMVNESLADYKAYRLSKIVLIP